MKIKEFNIERMKKEGWEEYLRDMLKNYKRSLLDKICGYDRKKSIEAQKTFFDVGFVQGIKEYQKYLISKEKLNQND